MPNCSAPYNDPRFSARKVKSRVCPHCKGSGRGPIPVTFRGFFEEEVDTGQRCKHCGGRGKVSR